MKRLATQVYSGAPRLGLALGAVAVLVAGCGSMPDTAAGLPQQARTTANQPLVPGAVSTVNIPAMSSSFNARPAKVYLPMNYGKGAPPPVLMLLSGVPGDVSDWFDSGEVEQILEQFAKDHGGTTPVIVAADDTGTNDEDLLCMDSPLGNVDAYLSQDVPAWINAHLRVDSNTQRWAVGGVSYGGTCAYELGVRHPKLFPTFLDFSGEQRPMRETREAAVDEVFAGDSAAYDKQDPLLILAAKKFPESAAILATGDDDAPYSDEQPAVVEACQNAGMQVRSTVIPGGHDWDTWTTAFRDALPSLVIRMGIGGNR